MKKLVFNALAVVAFSGVAIAENNINNPKKIDIDSINDVKVEFVLEIVRMSNLPLLRNVCQMVVVIGRLITLAQESGGIVWQTKQFSLNGSL